MNAASWAEIMSKPKAPTPPDPIATATAQGELNRINQNTPYGSLSYDTSGKNPDGTPQYTQNVTLSPSEQNLFNMGQQGQQQLGQIALGGLDRVQSAYGQNFDPSNYGASLKQAQDAAYGAQTQYLDPQFQQQGQTLDAKLANMGLSQGDRAYDDAQKNFGLQKQQAYQGAQNAAIGAGNQEQQILFNQGLTQYNQPLNTYNALMSGAQVQNPTFQQAPGIDYANIANQAFQNQNTAYQNKMAGVNNLFSLGGSLGSALIMP